MFMDISVQQLFIIDRMEECQKCCQCFLGFTVSRLPRQLNCGHNVCERCIEELQREEQNVLMCEYCQKTLQIVDAEELPYNQNIRLQLQEETKARSSEIIDQLNQQQGESLLEDDSDPVSHYVAHNTQSQPEQMCPIHHVIMDIICLTEKKKICPHCALFGAHKHHLFKRIQDFTKELSEKQHLFREILTEKGHHQGLNTRLQIQSVIRNKIALKKEALLNQLDQSIDSIIQSLKARKIQLMKEIEQYFLQLQVDLEEGPFAEEYKQSRQKFDDWQKLCWRDLKRLQGMSRMQEKVGVYFNGPLELVSEGFIYLEKYNRCEKQIYNKITEAVSMRLQIDNQILNKSIALIKPELSHLISPIKDNQDPNQINPFLDCNSSEICQPPPSLPHNNASIQAEISSLTSSVKVNGNQKTQLRVYSPLKPFSSAESIEKTDKVSAHAYKRRTITVTNTKDNNPFKDIRASQNFNSRSSQKLQKTTTSKPIIETDQKHYDLKQPQKIFTDFKKNTLTDFFDLSGCNLPTQKVVEFVSLARKSHKIKGLKLCSNNLDSAGFEKMMEFLKGVSNINLANNQIKQSIFDIILRNKQKLDMLRVLNLTHNPLTLERKARAKMQEIKKMGIIVLI